MDASLAARLNALTKQNEVLRDVRASYLLKEASRKHLESRMVRAAEGRSQAEKTVNAQSTDEWLGLQQEIAELESAFEFEKLKYEILDKAWLAEHVTYKIEDGLIKRHKGI